MFTFGTTDSSKAPASGELEKALHDARQEFDYLSSDPGLELMLQLHHIDQDDHDKARYWGVVDNYMQHKCQTVRSEGATERDTVFRELFAALPHYIHTQHMLDDHAHYIEEQAFERAKGTASRFNGLVRAAADAWPDLRASQLITALLAIAEATISGKELRTSADYYVHATVRGAQHETAFGQLLTRAGYEYRHGSTFQDLHGIDYVLLRHGQPSVYIDVKASLTEIRRFEGDQRLFERTRDGHLVMYSLLTDDELDDSFHVSEELAARKAHQLAALLRDAQSHKAHRLRRLHHHGKRLFAKHRQR